MFLLKLLLCAAFLAASQSSNSLGHGVNVFIKKKNVQNYSVFHYKNDSDYSFIEYNLYVQNTMSRTIARNVGEFQRNHTTSDVIIFENRDWNFDCVFNNQNNVYEGYSMDILGIVEELLNNTFVRHRYNSSLQRNSSNFGVNFSATLLFCNSADIFDQNIKILSPVVKSRYVLIYNKEIVTFSEDLFLMTFSGVLWLLFFTLLVVMAFLFRIASVYYQKIYDDCTSWSWTDINLWVIASASQQGLSFTPKKFATCTIFLLSYLLGYLLFSSCTADITSILLRENLNWIGYKDINSRNLGAVSLNYATDIEYVNTLKRHSSVNTIEELFDTIDTEYTVAIVPEILIDHYASKTKSFYKTHGMAKIDMYYEYSWFICEGHEYLETEINKSIIKLRQSGVLKRILGKHVRKFTKNEKYHSQAGLEHIKSGILLFIVGLLMSILFLAVEFLLAYYNERKQHVIGM